MAAWSPALDISEQWRLKFPKSGGQTPRKIATRAALVLPAFDGTANRAIAKALGVCRPAVLLWRKRSGRFGVFVIVQDASRPGRKWAVSADKAKGRG